MSEHLPECDPIPYERPCICERLRACEERVENRIIHGGLDASRFNAGLDAAREAVLAVVRKYNIAEDAPVIVEFLAAFDALRSKP